MLIYYNLYGYYNILVVVIDKGFDKIIRIFLEYV